jgi:hypothetical protein
LGGDRTGGAGGAGFLERADRLTSYQPERDAAGDHASFICTRAQDLSHAACGGNRRTTGADSLDRRFLLAIEARRDRPGSPGSRRGRSALPKLSARPLASDSTVCLASVAGGRSDTDSPTRSAGRSGYRAGLTPPLAILALGHEQFPAVLRQWTVRGYDAARTKSLRRRRARVRGVWGLRERELPTTRARPLR